VIEVDKAAAEWLVGIGAGAAGTAKAIAGEPAPTKAANSGFVGHGVPDLPSL